jgi:hypothetical protein
MNPVFHVSRHRAQQVIRRECQQPVEVQQLAARISP